ncbi:hypothetical protein PPL_08738 [Heterostelium album PN500]|uniref:tRNAHis guanylyltransferase catalytic domain-containing protein n=1 Tax=Heterostelium pallidum (strain ATCC 26659 / Pp 5 / PN500) TaxID=670386 RepID=D3BJL0_HETP5|nr:hypothetical protein PPL_08738 [Heterostelium album PN500]EFA78090.1 hypothetical protein PPL_08738 [Heterostelium album PN500]|eukprot:XP_020430217.1 hypothetical protein PPL_08738 [Heterostelium album PN500]
MADQQNSNNNNNTTAAAAAAPQKRDSVTLGDRMKQYEVSMNTLHITDNTPFIIRLDGHGFSKFTKNFVKPWDIRVHNAMVETATVLMKEFNPTLVYTFSDEITLCFSSLPDQEYQERLIATQSQSLLPYNGKVQKLITLAAGIASTTFYKVITSQTYDSATEPKLTQYLAESLPHFDARIFTLPDNQEIINNLVWRSVIDCKRNSISGLAQAHFPHKQIQGKGGKEMKSMLLAKGIDYYKEPMWYRFGVFLKKQYYTLDSVSPVNNQSVQSIRSKIRRDSFNIQHFPNALDYLTIKTLPENFDDSKLT